MTALSSWFLTRAERGNPDTAIDARRGDGSAWTEGNLVQPLIHGATYYRRLLEALAELGPGDQVHFVDWRGDRDERLTPDGPAVGDLLAGLAARGVAVRGLVWRSHPRLLSFTEAANRHLGAEINRSGGEVLLDERVRPFGSHHQKMVIVRRPGPGDDARAFVGGIDLCHSRRDDADHLGDPQPQPMARQYGPRPPWHDIQVEVQGPAVADLEHCFAERWHDPAPLDRRTPWRAALAWLAHEPRHPRPLRGAWPTPPPAGPHAVQVLRTYPPRHPPYPFARQGERSIARALIKAVRRARSLIYIEDQYLWSPEVAAVLATQLRRVPSLRLLAVVPRFPDADGRLTGPPNRIGQLAALSLLRQAGRERVGVFDLENRHGGPVYVHAKACVVDDVWALVGSDNFNRRSWTHDSELSCAVLDTTLDPRRPTDPGGQGDGARAFARSLRLQLWAEHLGRSPDDPALLDPEQSLPLWRATAATVAAWHAGGRRAAHPAGRVLAHHPAPVAPWAAWWARRVYRTLYDPDGRTAADRRAHRF
ncbi:MAG TPA: phospholipase D family protein [Candidatus Dormibacteraeota bacterium]|nr:phospholipase D family protein [Candidatus Dormibacteraeota bacterium]